MGIRFSNNAVSRLAGNLTDVSTTISLVPGGGASFPSLSGGDWFPATIVNSSGTLEIVKVTARSDDTLTVDRGQEGTAPSAFLAGERGDRSKAAVQRGELRLPALRSGQIAAAPTAADFNRLQADVAALHATLSRLAGTRI